jgi:hypothetical protein
LPRQPAAFLLSHDAVWCRRVAGAKSKVLLGSGLELRDAGLAADRNFAPLELPTLAVGPARNFRSLSQNHPARTSLLLNGGALPCYGLSDT